MLPSSKEDSSFRLAKGGTVQKVGILLYMNSVWAQR